MKLTLSDDYRSEKDRKTLKINFEGVNIYGVYLSVSPLGNCQTFSIVYMYKLLNLSKDELKFLLREIYKDIGRKQLLTDVQECSSTKLLDLFTPFSTNIITTPYVSTNGSLMVMHLIQLDTSKFME